MTMKLLAILLVSKYYCMYNLLETFNSTENIITYNSPEYTIYYKR